MGGIGLLPCKNERRTVRGDSIPPVAFSWFERPRLRSFASAVHTWTICAAPAQCRDRSDRWSQAGALVQDFNIGAWEEVSMGIRWPGWPAVVALLVVCVTMPAVAQQTWPQRAVKLIVPLEPGSGADIGARLMADRLSKRWDQPVIVENRPGGDAIPAITQFIGANDDHALFFAPSSVFIAHPFQYTRLSYDPAALIPVVKLSETLTTLSVPVVLNVSNLAGLVALAYQEPGKINWHALTSLNDMQTQAF